MSLLDIYDSTCVTKHMLIETADALFIIDYASVEPSRCMMMDISFIFLQIVFGLRKKCLASIWKNLKFL